MWSRTTTITSGQTVREREEKGGRSIVLDPLDKPDGVCEHPERAIVVGVDLDVRMLNRTERGAGEGLSVSLLGDVAMNEDVAWEGGSDDIFGDTGVRTSKTENLTKMGMLMDDDGVERYLGCLGSAASQLPITVHWHRRALLEYRPSPVAQRTALAGSTREGKPAFSSVHTGAPTCRRSATRRPGDGRP